MENCSDGDRQKLVIALRSYRTGNVVSTFTTDTGWLITTTGSYVLLTTRHTVHLDPALTLYT
jgi:hypothetical protein